MCKRSPTWSEDSGGEQEIDQETTFRRGALVPWHMQITTRLSLDDGAEGRPVGSCIAETVKGQRQLPPLTVSSSSQLGRGLLLSPLPAPTRTYIHLHIYFWRIEQTRPNLPRMPTEVLRPLKDGRWWKPGPWSKPHTCMKPSCTQLDKGASWSSCLPGHRLQPMHTQRLQLESSAACKRMVGLCLQVCWNI